MMKTFFDKILSIFKLKPFYWVVLFITSCAVLFGPNKLLIPLGLDKSVILGWIRSFIGLVALTCGVLIFCWISNELFIKFKKFCKIWALRKKILKEIVALSYPEKLLLYSGIVLGMKTVICPIDNKIAGILVSKGILLMSTAPSNPYSFIIHSVCWDFLKRKKI